jgi:hypothetical protein
MGQGRATDFRHQGEREQAIRERELKARERLAEPVTITMTRQEWRDVLRYQHGPMCKIEEAIGGGC